MLDQIQDYFYSEPGRITEPGKLLSRFGTFLLLAGAIGRFVTGTNNILPTLAQQPQATKSLADIYPTLPLWWVPESWLGVISSVLLIAVGMSVALHGKNVDRMLR